MRLVFNIPHPPFFATGKTIFLDASQSATQHPAPHSFYKASCLFFPASEIFFSPHGSTQQPRTQKKANY
ncbi:unknown [Prevotella sp. CAG:617]|nr:unknown [Prevotella sp. CAG:617]